MKKKLSTNISQASIQHVTDTEQCLPTFFMSWPTSKLGMLEMGLTTLSLPQDQSRIGTHMQWTPALIFWPTIHFSLQHTCWEALVGLARIGMTLNQQFQEGKSISFYLTFCFTVRITDNEKQQCLSTTKYGLRPHPMIASFAGLIKIW